MFITLKIGFLYGSPLCDNNPVTDPLKFGFQNKFVMVVSSRDAGAELFQVQDGVGIASRFLALCDISPSNSNFI